MSKREIEEALPNSGLLRDIPSEHLSQLAEIAELVDFPEGTLILREGQRAEKVYVLLSGNVSIEICAPGVGCRRIMTLSEGDLLSWSSILEQRSTASARAITEIKAVAIDGRQLLALCEHDPALGFAFMRRVASQMAQRLVAARMQLIDVFGTTMPTAPDSGSGANASGARGNE